MSRHRKFVDPEKTINKGTIYLHTNFNFRPFQHLIIFNIYSKSRWIDPAPGSELTMFMEVDGCQNNSANTVNYVEHVQCRISLKFFPRGDLRILLISPMGTESVLLFERPLDIASGTFDDWPFLSVHYWGEKIAGRWEIKITRRMANSTAKSPGNIHCIEI